MYLLAIALVVAGSPQEEARQHEEAVVAARKRIQRLDIILRSEGASLHRELIRYKRTERFWIDGAKARRDTLVPCERPAKDMAKIEGEAEPELKCWETISIGCDVDGKPMHVMFTNQDSGIGGIPALVARRMEDTTDEKYQFSDPRWLGLFLESAQSLMHRKSLSEFVEKRAMQSKARLSAPELETVELNGKKALKISYQRAPNDRITEWLGQGELDGCVLQIEFLSKSADGKLEHRSVVQTEYQHVKKADLWFPETVTYENVSGDVTTASQVAKVEVRSINAPINPRVFTLGGIEYLSPGATIYVAGRDAFESKTWDGSSLKDVDHEAAGTEDALPEASIQRFPNFWRLLFGVNLLLAGLGMAAFLLFRRARS